VDGALHVPELAEDLAEQRERLDLQRGPPGEAGDLGRALRHGQAARQAPLVEIQTRRAHQRERHPVRLLALAGEAAERGEVRAALAPPAQVAEDRSEEHTSELQSLAY